MHVDRQTGRLSAVRQVASPNYNDRPDPEDISLVVIHGISLPLGEFGGPAIEALFTNRLDPQHHPFFEQIRELQVSAHLLIRRDGEVIQFVPFDKRAWHAGVSEFAGRANCNDYSIGIELEGTDTLPYTDDQYRALSEVLRALQAAYSSISVERIVGHSDVAPGRKTDPGASFDWVRLREDLAD